MRRRGAQEAPRSQVAGVAVTVHPRHRDAFLYSAAIHNNKLARCVRAAKPLWPVARARPLGQPLLREMSVAQLKVAHRRHGHLWLVGIRVPQTAGPQPADETT